MMQQQQHIDWDAIHAGLIAEFPPEDIKQREGAGGLMFDYIDSRAVQDRLDAVVGPQHWSDAYTLILPESLAVECTLTIHGISKSDVGYPNSAADAGNPKAEPLKASYSDALKRSAVQWGIGRFLYSRPPARAGQSSTARPATRSGSGGGISDKQWEFIVTLCGQTNERIPPREGMTPTDASREIDRLKALKLGGPPAGSDEASDTDTPAPTGAPPQVRDRRAQGNRMSQACVRLAAARDQGEGWQHIMHAAAESLGIHNVTTIGELSIPDLIRITAWADAQHAKVATREEVVI